MCNGADSSLLACTFPAEVMVAKAACGPQRARKRDVYKKLQAMGAIHMRMFYTERTFGISSSSYCTLQAARDSGEEFSLEQKLIMKPSKALILLVLLCVVYVAAGEKTRLDQPAQRATCADAQADGHSRQLSHMQ